MSKNCIVVPVYKQFSLLSTTELLCLNQLYKVLGIHSIYLVGSVSLDFDGYIDHAIASGTMVSTKTYDEIYFDSISGYNRLLLSEFFYKGFNNHEFILIYQTDAYVFRDELDTWCKKGYDFIGAPWSGIHAYDDEMLVGVGNGGFSLRRINGAFKMLKKLRIMEVLEDYKHFNGKGIIPRLPSIIFKLWHAIHTPCNFEKANWQEDIFWCKRAPKRLDSFTCNAYLLKLLARLLIKNNFRIASEETAIQFSMETKPRELYKRNHETLPFGCHAWEKYEPEFWKEFILIN